MLCSVDESSCDDRPALPSISFNFCVASVGINILHFTCNVNELVLIHLNLY